jgi:iron complex outermembrane receptor protein
MKHIFQRSAVAAAIYTLLGTGLGAGSGSVAAQTPEPQGANHLDEVTITAHTLERRDLMVPAQQLSGAALTQRQGSTLGETLDNLPGIANSSYGPNVGRPVIRGMDGDRIRILQNSGANMDVSGLSNDHAVPLDPLTIERIEVLRGPATLLYGGSAMGGVVNMIDNRIARERMFDDNAGVMGKAEVRAGGAAGERSSAAMVEAGNDKLVLHVDAFERRTQNLRVPKEMSCDGTPNGRRVCNSASDSQGSAVGGTLLFDRGYLGLSTSEYRSTYGTVAEPTVSIGMLRRHHVMEGQLREVGAFKDIKFQLGHTRYTHTEFETPQATDGTRFDNKGHDFRLEGRQSAITLGNGMQLEGVLGLQNERSQVQTRDAQGAVALLPPSRTQNTGVFSYQALKTDWGQLSAGARVESVTVQSFEASGPSAEIPAQTQKFTPTSFALGAMRDLRQGDAQNGWQLSTNLSASQRAPKDYELYAHGVHAATGTYEIGQANLGVEKGTQLDVGGEWKQGAHRFGITGFASQFSNYISLQATDVNATLPQYTFQGVRARFYGVESTAKIRLVAGQDAMLTSNATHGAMDLELRADAVRAQDLSHNSPMPRIAPLRLGADAVWSRNAWGARLGFVHAAAQNRVPNQGAHLGIPTAGHTLWNAGLNYHTHSGPTHWLLFAKLDNLTNKLAYSSTSVMTQTLGSNAPPLAGRSLKLGAQVSF